MEDITQYINSPTDWIEHWLQTKLWYRQKEIVNSVKDNDLTAAQSGHGIGKTYVAASTVLEFTFNHPSPCIVITTAPTKRQVEAALWAEIGELHQHLQDKFGFAGEMLQLQLRLGRKHYAMGFSTDKPDAFQGLHAEHMLVVFDEACGIVREIYESAESLISAAGNKTLLIGNPTEPNTYFHHCCTGRIPGYNVIKVSSTECPNVRQREDGLYEDIDPIPFPGLVSARWINQKILTYGKHSNYCKSRVFGEFPTTAEDQLIDGKHVALALLKGAQIRSLLHKLAEANYVMRSDEMKKIIGR